MSNLFFVVISLLVTCCNAQNKIDYQDLEEQVKNEYLSRGYITPTLNDRISISIYGLHNKIYPQNDLKNGIYRVNSSGSHSFQNFVIYDQNELIFLDVYTIDNLQSSINLLLNYTFQENYCKELTLKYVSSLILSHYYSNRYPPHAIELNCEFPPENLISTFDRNGLTQKIAFKIEQQENIAKEKIELDDIYPGVVDFYFTLPTEGKLNTGIYYYVYAKSDDLLNKYFIVYENKICFLELNDNETFINSIQEILNFNYNNQICLYKTLWVLEEVFDDFMKESCLSKITKELP